MALLIHSPEISTAPQIAHNPNPKPCNFNSFRPSTNGKAIGTNRRVKISCKVRDYAVLDLGLDQIVRPYGQFSVPVKQGSRSSKEEEEEKQNYYLNLGYAIRTLREEFPDLFYKELSFGIYRLGFYCLYFMILLCDGWVCEKSLNSMIFFIGFSTFRGKP